MDTPLSALDEMEYYGSQTSVPMPFLRRAETREGGEEVHAELTCRSDFRRLAEFLTVQGFGDPIRTEVMVDQLNRCIQIRKDAMEYYRLHPSRNDPAYEAEARARHERIVTWLEAIRNFIGSKFSGAANFVYKNVRFTFFEAHEGKSIAIRINRNDSGPPENVSITEANPVARYFAAGGKTRKRKNKKRKTRRNRRK